MKNNLKYIILLSIGFLWCSLVYLSQELIFLKFFDEKIVNSIILTYDSFAMALGILAFIILSKKNFNIKKIYLIFLIISFILNILFYVLNISNISLLISVIICLLGSAGFGVAYHFTIISTHVKKENRGIVFAIGYSVAVFLTYLISLIPGNFIKSPKLLLITIPLIIINIFIIYKMNDYKNQKKEESMTKFEKKKLFLLIIIILVMSLISSFSSNMFAIINKNPEIGFAYSRIYYAFGLLAASFIADKNNRLFDIFTLASLFYPLLSIILLKEQVNITSLANLNYFFISFFVVYRTLSFMNITGKHKIYFAPLGLCICRTIEGLLSLINSYIEFSYLFLVISIIILLIITIGVYIYLYSLNFINKEDVFEEFCIKYKLSIQEKKVLNLILKDYSNQDIASTFVVSINTVRNHVAHIYKKCQMKKSEIKEIINKKTI